MSHPVQSESVYRFGVFQADLQNRELLRKGIRVRLQEKPFQVLAEFLCRPGEVVTREDLRHRLWPAGTYVDFDEGVNTAVKRLRLSLGDSSANPIYIETVARYGYRFIAPVSRVEAENALPPEPEVNPEVNLARPLSLPEAEAFSRKTLLPWLILALLATGVAAFAMYGHWKSGGKTTLTPVQSIAVLPLENLSGDTSQEYFAEGITDEITTDLAKLAGPKVISRTSAMQYKQTHKTIPEIARELNVGAIVEGSVERSGDRVRVRVQLIQASTDQHLWAEEYDRQLSDVLHLEADVAQDIARQIQLHLTPQQQQNLAERRPTNPQAFQDYLQGRHYWALRTHESLAKAIEYFNRAIQEDPGDARSYAGLAHCYIVLPMVTPIPFTEANQKARAAATKSLALDDSLPEAHLAAAEIRFYQDWDFTAAEREFRKTLELNSNYSTGHQWYGEFLSVMGRHEEAIRELETALALDPLSAVVHHQAGQTFQQARQYDRALSEYRKAVDLNSSFYFSYEAMYWALRREGKFREAGEIMRRTQPYWKSGGEVSTLIDSLPSAYAQGGRNAFLRQSLKLHQQFRDANYYTARDYADLGDRERALQQLNKAFEDHTLVLWIGNEPEFDRLRSDPRFQRLVQAMGLPR